jgi:hypothetical protein
MFAINAMLAPAATGGGVSLAYSYEGLTNASLDTGTTYNTTATAIGTADASRLVVVFVAIRGSSATITSGTIGGVSADIASFAPFSGSRGVTAIWAEVPTGTTADIVTTFSSDPGTRVEYLVYRVVGLSSATAHDEAESTSGSVSIDIPADGFAFAVGVGAASDDLSLGGVTTIDKLNDGGGLSTEAGTKETVTLLTGHTITSTNATGLYAVSFA